MIKKLRINFTIAASVSLLVVLTVIIGCISILSYREVISNADDILAILAENDGKFPDDVNHRREKPFPGQFHEQEILLSPELPYESRYFSVVFNLQGDVLSVNTGKIAAIDTSQAITYAQTATASKKEKGFLNDYRYVVHTEENQTQIIFLDCMRSLHTFRTSVLIGIGVSLGGLLAVSFLIFVLSGRIVKPFLENYEKQKRFITDAGHELKTPLTIIDADTEVMEMDYGTNEWLEDIRAQTKRLTELTNALILLSRMEEDQPKTNKIVFPLSDLVEEIVESFRGLAKAQDKTLSVQIEPMISLYADEKAIRQLVTILLDNAMKYAQSGGKIALGLEKQKNTVQLSVWNTTNAITKEHLTYLFDRFYRTDQSRNSQTGGYGLGLSIAYAIVQAHHGKIVASTKDEKSLLMTVTLPVCKKGQIKNKTEE